MIMVSVRRCPGNASIDKRRYDLVDQHSDVLRCNSFPGNEIPVENDQVGRLLIQYSVHDVDGLWVLIRAPDGCTKLARCGRISGRPKGSV